MSQRKANILNSKTNINSVIDTKQLINTNSDDLKAIQQHQKQHKELQIQGKDIDVQGNNNIVVPLVKDNNNLNANQCDSNSIIGNPYSRGVSYTNNPYNSYGNGLYTGYSNYGMGMGMNYIGQSNTFFDKLFMTFERANYQMYHLCEMIKMIQNQTPTIKYFYQLLLKGYYYLLDKSQNVYEQTKLLYHFFSQLLSFHSPTTDSETLQKEIKAIDFLLKIAIITCLTGLVVKLYSA